MTNTNCLRRNLEIDAPAADVWRVLTDPELVREWAAAYQDGLSIRTTWREGDPVTWTFDNGATRACGRVAAFKPERLLKFEYTEGDANPVGFSDTFELAPDDGRTRLEFTVGPLEPASFERLKGPFEHVVQEIKSLAEESAQIRAQIQAKRR